MLLFQKNFSSILLKVEKVMLSRRKMMQNRPFLALLTYGAFF